MLKKTFSMLLVLAFVLSSSASVWAQDVASRVANLERAVQSLSESHIGNSGIEVSLGATTVFQGVLSNANGTTGRTTDATYSFDMIMQKEFENGRAFAYLEAGQNAGVDGVEVNTLSAVNGDAGPSSSGSALEVSELWYEHYLMDGDLTLKVGKIDVGAHLDNNAYAGSESTQFLGGAFIDNPAIEYGGSLYLLGVNALYAASDSLDIQVGVFEEDSNFGDILDESFAYLEFNFKPQFMDRPGNYRVYGFVNGDKDTKLDDAGARKTRNPGLGLSFDQEVSDNVGMFFRFGWQNPDTEAVEAHYSIGSQIGGALWDRENDYAGIAIGQNFVAEQRGGTQATGINNSTEGHLELYYSYAFTDYLTISPHYQLVWNPNGVSEGNQGANSGAISVVSLRTQLNFG